MQLNSLRKTHLRIFVGFYLAFAALTFLVLNQGTESDRRSNAVASATLGAVSGPLTGAIARNFQSCCLRFSLEVLPYSALALGIGFLLQIIPLPIRRAEKPVRLALWCIGLLGWFGGGIVSFGHALS